MGISFGRAASVGRVFLVAFGSLVLAPHHGYAADCPLPPGITGRVAAIVSGDTFVLEDGQPVRLAAVAILEDQAGAAFPVGEAAQNALTALLAGRRVEVRATAAEPDRYGRVVAQVFLADEGGAWVQARLVEGGTAVVRTTGADAGCGRALLAVEAMAREAHAGLWADPAYAPVSVDAPALRDVDGVFAIVEGRVVSVGRTERTVYLNFGADWSSDFTAVIAAAIAGDLDLGGPAVDDLGGRRVRLRGWIETWDGPSMRLDHAEQIEVLP